MNYEKLADLLLPDVDLRPEDILQRYPKRNLPEGAKVTRVGPSPTGFLHMGTLLAALVPERLAHQSGGIFYLRIEDTDKKREIQGSIPGIIESLDYFGIHFDEGEVKPDQEAGHYGPYKQSARRQLYRVFVKELIRKGLAYPCFCSAEDLNRIRRQQKEEKQLPGYHGKWAAHRNASMESILAELEAGKPYVIRLKSPGNPDKRFLHHDLVKEDIELPENIQDIVLLKSDGLPTYHFAHAVDDTLMGTTHVFRADEWLPSVPIHLQLFEVLGWNPPPYGHIAPIMKLEGTSRRKFSKRKDPEFAVDWYRQQGYPGAAVIEYLLSLANSNYEEWRLKNPKEPYSSFTVTTEKMSGSGPLFDINKFNDICRNVIATMSAAEVYEGVLNWASRYDTEFHSLLVRHKEDTMKVLQIDRDSDKPRKDFANWSEVKPMTSYFYDELFDPAAALAALRDLPGILEPKEIIKAYMGLYDGKDDKAAWFEKVKDLSESLGYARDMKSYRKNPSAYKGHVGDVAMVLRVALTGRTATPDLYEILQILGKDRVIRRLEMHV